MGQCGRGRGAVVGSAAAVSELSSVKGAAAGGATRKAVLLRGANTVCGGRGGGTTRRGAATGGKIVWDDHLLSEYSVCQHTHFLDSVLTWL